MAAITDLYIDEIYIERASTTGGTNSINGESFYTGMNGTEGYKWVCAIGNNHASAYNFQANDKLNICTNYLKNGAVDFDMGSGVLQKDTIISLSGTINGYGLIFVGFTITGGPPITVSSSILLGDQKTTIDETEYISAASRFNITSGSGFGLAHRDTCGTNTVGSAGAGLYYYLYDTQSLGSAGSIRRKPADADTPTSSFNTSHWETSTGLSNLTVSAAGDPHIKTLDGEYYEFDYLGSFRLLEDTIDGEKLIINGKSEPGPTRWKNNQYIKKLFIQKGENYILIDMGFRGEKVNIIEEKGFSYKEEELEFHEDAQRYSLTSRYKTSSRTEPVTEDLPRFIRNKINFTINDNNENPLIFFEISNVNEYNLQPCRLHIQLANHNVYTENAKGCLISRIHAPACKLNDVKSCEPIDLSSLEDMDEIPKLEINPAKRNKQWN